MSTSSRSTENPRCTVNPDPAGYPELTGNPRSTGTLGAVGKGEPAPRASAVGTCVPSDRGGVAGGVSVVGKVSVTGRASGVGRDAGVGVGESRVPTLGSNRWCVSTMSTPTCWCTPWSLPGSAGSCSASSVLLAHRNGLVDPLWGPGSVAGPGVSRGARRDTGHLSPSTPVDGESPVTGPREVNPVLPALLRDRKSHQS